MASNAEIDALVRLLRRVERGDYAAISLFSAGNYGPVAALDFVYDKIPDKYKYQTVIDIYEHNSPPEMKKYVRDIMKFRPDTYLDKLPSCLTAASIFTVYRAGPEDYCRAQNSLSWTLCRDVAEDFYIKHSISGVSHLFQGTISRNKVISYSNGRFEFEVLQYRNVRNISEIIPRGVSAEYKKVSKQREAMIFNCLFEEVDQLGEALLTK